MEEHAVDILKKQNQMGEQVVEFFESCSKGLCQCETPIYGGFFFCRLLSFVDTILEVGGGFTKMLVFLSCCFRHLFSLVNIV